MAVVVIQSKGIVSTGSDEQAGAVNWSNIIAADARAVHPIGSTNAQTVSAIDTPVTWTATFTTEGAPVVFTWVVNGSELGYGDSPRAALVRLGDEVILRSKLLTATGPQTGTGVVTVVNSSDADAAVDDFTYYLERTS